MLVRSFIVGCLRGHLQSMSHERIWTNRTRTWQVLKLLDKSHQKAFLVETTTMWNVFRNPFSNKTRLFYCISGMKFYSPFRRLSHNKVILEQIKTWSCEVELAIDWKREAICSYHRISNSFVCLSWCSLANAQSSNHCRQMHDSWTIMLFSCSHSFIHFQSLNVKRAFMLWIRNAKRCWFIRNKRFKEIF